MVHHEIAPGTDLCAAAPSTMSGIYPHSYFVGSESKVIPFEYSTTPLRAPGDSFIRHISTFFTSRGFDKLLGITSISSQQKPTIEHQLSDGGTIATEVSDVSDFLNIRGIDTVWAFSPRNSDVAIQVLRKCEVNSSGGHKVAEHSAT